MGSYIRWNEWRKGWLRRHPPEYYICGVCGEPVHEGDVTLDHIYPVSTHPNLQYNETNIRPAHNSCNVERGQGFDEDLLEAFNEENQ